MRRKIITEILSVKGIVIPQHEAHLIRAKDKENLLHRKWQQVQQLPNRLPKHLPNHLPSKLVEHLPLYGRMLSSLKSRLHNNPVKLRHKMCSQTRSKGLPPRNSRQSLQDEMLLISKKNIAIRAIADRIPDMMRPGVVRQP